MRVCKIIQKCVKSIQITDESREYFSVLPLRSSPISYLLTKKMTSSSQSNTSNLVPYEIEQRTNGLHIHLVKIRLYFLRVRECMESTFEEGLLSTVLLKS